MDKIDFYRQCARISDTALTLPSGLRKTRWGPRQPGPGRMVGYGTATWYSKDCIHVNLNAPVKETRTFDDPERALEWLEDVFKTDGNLAV